MAVLTARQAVLRHASHISEEISVDILIQERISVDLVFAVIPVALDVRAATRVGLGQVAGHQPAATAQANGATA